MHPLGSTSIGYWGIRVPRGMNPPTPDEVRSRRVITRSSECLALLTRGTWHPIDQERLALPPPAAKRTRPPPPLSVTISTELVDLADRFPEFQELYEEILSGLSSAIGDSLPVRASIHLETDLELPSWTQLVVTIHPREGLTDAEAFELWDRLEEHVRPRLEGFSMTHEKVLSRAPVDLSNENISIRLKW